MPTQSKTPKRCRIQRKSIFLHLRHKFHEMHQKMVKKNELCIPLHQIALRWKRAGYLGTRQAMQPVQLKKFKNNKVQLNKILLKWLGMFFYKACSQFESLDPNIFVLKNQFTNLLAQMLKKEEHQKKFSASQKQPYVHANFQKKEYIKSNF